MLRMMKDKLGNEAPYKLRECAYISMGGFPAFGLGISTPKVVNRLVDSFLHGQEPMAIHKLKKALIDTIRWNRENRKVLLDRLYSEFTDLRQAGDETATKKKVYEILDELATPPNRQG